MSARISAARSDWGGGRGEGGESIANVIHPVEEKTDGTDGRAYQGEEGCFPAGEIFQITIRREGNLRGGDVEFISGFFQKGADI